MANYAYVDKNNIVINVISGRDENDSVNGITDWEKYYGAIRTSYNGKIRGNYAGIGFTYFPDEDLFMPPKCHDEATLNVETAQWECGNSDHEITFSNEG